MSLLTIFLITSSSVFPNFLTNYSSESASSEKKVLLKRVFLTHNLEFVVIIRTKRFSITFFLIHKSRP